MAKNVKFSYSRNQYFIQVTEHFLNLVNLLKLRDLADCLHPSKRSQKV